MEVIFGSGPLPFILAKAQPKPKSGYYWAHINKGLRVSQVYTFSLLGATLLCLPSTAPYFSLARCSLSFLPLGLPLSLSALSPWPGAWGSAPRGGRTRGPGRCSRAGGELLPGLAPLPEAITCSSPGCRRELLPRLLLRQPTCAPPLASACAPSMAPPTMTVVVGYATDGRIHDSGG
jgi:hypothetical protein